MQRKDLTGQRFGICTVIRNINLIKKGNRNYSQWELKCDCGKLFIVSHENLISKRTKNRNCGCLYRTDLTNKKFGLLTVIQYLETKLVGKNNSQAAVWECLCECGKTTKVTTLNLMHGNVQSCGCMRGIKQSMYINTKYNITISYVLSKIKTAAKKRNLECNLTIDDLNTLIQKQNFKCALSGLPIKIEDASASLDRINSEIGYTLNNIQFIYKPYNVMKSILKQDEFIELCKLVSNNNPSY